MGDVDIADQPRNIIGLIIGQESLSGGGLLFLGYCYYPCQCLHFYGRVNLETGVSKSNLLSYHNFHKQVVMAWISLNIYWSTDMNGPALSTW